MLFFAVICKNENPDIPLLHKGEVHENTALVHLEKFANSHLISHIDEQYCIQRHAFYKKTQETKRH